MEILRFSNGIYPELLGGIEVNVQQISAFQARDGHDVKVFVPRHPEIGESPNRGFDVEFYNPGRVVFGNPLSTYPYQVISDNARRDTVVHTHSHLFFPSNLAALAKIQNDFTFVITSEGLTSQLAPEWIQSGYLRTIGALTFKAADLVLAYTPQEVEWIRDLGIPAERVKHISQGVDTDSLTPRYNHPNGSMDLLWVSRHVPGKGADIAVRVVEELERREIKSNLTMIGDGPGRRGVEELAEELGVRDRVNFILRAPESELRDLYSSSDLLILPSRTEGMNRTVLEALASGTPAVTSDLPHLADFLRGCGATARERTPEAFADAIEDLLDGDIEKLGRVGREKVVDNHSWEAAYQDVKAAFEWAVSSR